MTWLQIIAVTLQLVNGLVAWLHSRQLLQAGEAKAIADSLKVTNDRIKAALDARRRARDSDPNPDDPYLRD